MNEQVVIIKKIGINGDIIKISIQEGVEVSNAMPKLTQLIDNCYKNNLFKILLDMQRIKFPSATFIALLIEKTIQARRVGGDLKLINISPSATNNLVTFSPLSYLSVDGDEGYAIEELESMQPKTPSPIPETKLPEQPVTEHTSNVPEKRTPEKKAPVISPPVETPQIEPKPSFSLKEPDIQLESLQAAGRRAISQQVHHRPVTSKPKVPPVKQANTSKKQPPTRSAKKPRKVQKTIRPSAQPNKTGSQSQRIRVKSKIDSLYDICDFVTGLALKAGFSEKEVGKIKVTVYEASLNVIEHAYHSDPDEWIVTTVQQHQGKFIIIIQDWGESFDFNEAKRYDVNQAVHERKTGGFGMFIIRRSMDSVKYKTDPVNGNRLILTKLIPGTAKSS